MKRYTWIWIMLIALLSGCEDDFDKGGSNPGEGVTEGMITFRFSTEEAPVIVTRVGETGQQESLENVLVMVFDKDGKLVNKAYQQLTIDNHSVNIYLTAVEDQSIYALCNLPEGDETEDLINNSPVTLTGLKAKYTTIRTPEGAYGVKQAHAGDHHGGEDHAQGQNLAAESGNVGKHQNIVHVGSAVVKREQHQLVRLGAVDAGRRRRVLFTHGGILLS